MDLKNKICCVRYHIGIEGTLDPRNGCGCTQQNHKMYRMHPWARKFACGCTQQNRKMYRMHPWVKELSVDAPNISIKCTGCTHHSQSHLWVHPVGLDAPTRYPDAP